ncbi:hypothetical protein KY333_04735 [Candidatus Woesearchaeota archaeon]|nr:hypothetical protein [Candidatus Woesearchaeota archaeon]
MKKKHVKKSNDETYKISKKQLGYAILVLAVIVILIALYYQGVFDSFLPEQKEEVKPEKQVLGEIKIIPEVELTAVTIDCKECINASQAADIISDAPIFKVLKTEFIESDSEEGKALIEKYDLKRLPAFIMTGEEISNIDLPTFEKREGAQVFDATPPPYYDVDSEKIKGLVEVIKLTDTDCEKCFDLNKLTVNLKQFGIKFASEKEVSIDSDEGKELVSDYSITKVPTLFSLQMLMNTNKYRRFGKQ